MADGLVRFGVAIARARRELGLSQDQLERLSGVDQTTISRLERGLAPKTPVHRLVWLGILLGRSMPLGACPHEHECPWQRSDPPAECDPAGHWVFVDGRARWMSGRVDMR